MKARLKSSKSIRSPEYLDYIRSMPCYVCQNSPSEPHHTGAGGVGVKGSDFTCVPLCRRHHALAHSMGCETFQEEYGIRFNDVIVANLVPWAERLTQQRPG